MQHIKEPQTYECTNHTEFPFFQRFRLVVLELFKYKQFDIAFENGNSFCDLSVFNFI